MKKILLFGVMAMTALCMAACGGDAKDDGGETPGPGPGPGPDPTPAGNSTQMVNKTFAAPVENFPGIEVFPAEFSILKGKYQALLGETEFDGDALAEGVTLPEAGSVVTIKQNGKTIVTFTALSAGAGAKIRLTGVGSTSDLANLPADARGIYKWVIREGHADYNGYLKGTNFYEKGDPSKLVKSVTLEGGRKYLLRRDYMLADNPKDVEGYIYFWPDMAQGYPVSDPNWAMSIYPEDSKGKPIDQQVPLYTSHSVGNAGMYSFVITNFTNPNTTPWQPGYDGEDHVWFYVQGMGELRSRFAMNDLSIKFSEDLVYEVTGLNPEIGNPDPWARAFEGHAAYKVFLGDTKDVTAATEATAEQYASFVSNDGLTFAGVGKKYIMVKLTDYESMVNTAEDMVFVFSQKAGSATEGVGVRFECMQYDQQKNALTVIDGMNFRALPMLE